MPLDDNRVILTLNINRPERTILVMRYPHACSAHRRNPRLPPSPFQPSAKDTPAQIKITIVAIANIFKRLLSLCPPVPVEFNPVRRERRREGLHGVCGAHLIGKPRTVDTNPGKSKTQLLTGLKDGCKCRESPTIRFRHHDCLVIPGGRFTRLFPGHLFFTIFQAHPVH